MTESFYGANYELKFADDPLRLTPPPALLEAQINTQRLFLVHSPEDYAEEMLIFLTRDYFWSRISTHEGLELIFRSMVKSSQVLMEDINYLVDDSESTRIQLARRIWSKSNSLEFRGGPRRTLDEYDSVLDAAGTKLGYQSLLQSCIVTKSEKIVSVLDSGAHCHLVSRSRFRKSLGCRVNFQVVEPQKIYTLTDTPTSSALHTSDDFYYWRTALLEAGVDIRDFVNEELDNEAEEPAEHVLHYEDMDGVEASKRMPLHDFGWNKDALIALFRRDIVPSTCKRICLCGESQFYQAYEPQSMLKQQKWLQFLAMMKRSCSQTENIRLADRSRITGNDGQEIPGFEKKEPENANDIEISRFCFPDHEGCYLCWNCWTKTGYQRDFWDTRDIDPDFEMPSRISEVEGNTNDNDEDSPFLLSL
jgi:hypothetical protein